MRENVGFGAGMRGVVAEVDDVEVASGRGRGHQGASVGGDRQISHQAARLEPLGSVENPRRHGPVPHAEQQHIGVIEAQGTQRALQAPAHQGRGPRIRLDHQRELIAPRAEAAQRGAERIAPHAAPIEIIHSLLEGALDGFARHPVTGGHSQPRHLPPRPAQKDA